MVHITTVRLYLISENKRVFAIGVKEGERDSLLEAEVSEESVLNYGAINEEEEGGMGGLYDFSYDDIRAFLDDWSSPNIGIQVYLNQ